MRWISWLEWWTHRHWINSAAYVFVWGIMDNGLSLCAKHHAMFHDNPVMAGRFYERLLGREKLDTLWIKAQAKATIDRQAVLDSLRGGG